MASTAFTEAVTPANIYRGRASVGIKPYASGALADLGALVENTDVEINLLGELTKEMVHQLPGPYKAHIINAEVEVLFEIAERTANSMAYLFGKDSGDVTDNTGNTPTDMRVAYGDRYGLDEWRIQVQIPLSEAAAPLYHMFVLFKAYFDPSAGKFKYGKKVTPQGHVTRVGSLCDPDDATYPNAHAMWVIEYS